MKLVMYVGHCKSLNLGGLRFTPVSRTANIPDEQSMYFENRDDFKLIDIEKSDIVPEDKKDEKVFTKESLKKLSLDDLKIEATKVGVSIEGSKSEIIESLTNLDDTLEV